MDTFNVFSQDDLQTSLPATPKGSRVCLSGVYLLLGILAQRGVIPKLKTEGKRLRVKLKRVNMWARGIRSRYRLRHIWQVFCAKLRGHIRYYGVSFNCKAVWQFVWGATRILFRWLNRRSQRTCFTWEQFLRFIRRNPHPAVTVYHPLF